MPFWSERNASSTLARVLRDALRARVGRVEDAGVGVELAHRALDERGRADTRSRPFATRAVPVAREPAAVRRDRVAAAVDDARAHHLRVRRDVVGDVAAQAAVRAVRDRRELDDEGQHVADLRERARAARPGPGGPAGSMSATVCRLIRLAVATCATESALASVPTSSERTSPRRGDRMRTRSSCGFLIAAPDFELLRHDDEHPARVEQRHAVTEHLDVDREELIVRRGRDEVVVGVEPERDLRARLHRLEDVADDRRARRCRRDRLDRLR